MKDDEDNEKYPKLTDYCFSVDISGLICEMQDLGNKVRWPKTKNKYLKWNEKYGCCAYHEDFGHMTEDCLAFRKEVNYLVSKGYLNRILGRKKDKIST